jgi:hypothetical protein
MLLRLRQLRAVSSSHPPPSPLPLTADVIHNPHCLTFYSFPFLYIVLCSWTVSTPGYAAVVRFFYLVVFSPSILLLTIFISIRPVRTLLGPVGQQRVHPVSFMYICLPSPSLRRALITACLVYVSLACFSFFFFFFFFFFAHYRPTSRSQCCSYSLFPSLLFFFLSGRHLHSRRTQLSYKC